MAERIVIIEDDAKYAEGLADKLRAVGYDVNVKLNGEEGFEEVKSTVPDLVVLDLMLPLLDGYSMCRMIRMNSTVAHIGILMLTARGSEGDKIVGLDHGADDYVVKTAELGEIIARVRTVLRRARRTPTPVEFLESGNLYLDLIRRKAYINQVEFRMSNKEFDLLAYMMRNKGDVLSRGLLLTQVWGYDNFIGPATVNVHVRWLREKIEENASDPRRITSIRGVGYRFEG